METTIVPNFNHIPLWRVTTALAPDDLALVLATPEGQALASALEALHAAHEQAIEAHCAWGSCEARATLRESPAALRFAAAQAARETAVQKEGQALAAAKAAERNAALARLLRRGDAETAEKEAEKADEARREARIASHLAWVAADEAYREATKALHEADVHPLMAAANAAEVAREKARTAVTKAAGVLHGLIMVTPV